MTSSFASSIYNLAPLLMVRRVYSKFLVAMKENKFLVLYNKKEMKNFKDL